MKPLLILTLVCSSLFGAPTIDAAFARIYSFDFANGRALGREYSAQNDQDPLGPAVVAAADLFAELERLKLLTQEPGGGKAQGKPDPAVWERIQTSSRLAERRAQTLLSKDPDDPKALMALMLIHGLERDYLALVEKSYRQSWASAKLAQQYALRLTRTHPDLQDAWFTIGFSDYLVSSVPFFLKPFMKMEAAEGNRTEAIANLRKAAVGGRYLKGFAQLLLAQIYRKDKRKAESDQMLRRLAKDYPDNPIVSRGL
ncbi:MAG: hypothetical protein K2X03_25895 [Bryobacteraceae bacterium]|nr:hypothetical protein [Bryobacteraceae bacterium]